MDTRTDPSHAALIARSHTYGLQTREENGGLLLWWPDERVSDLIPLPWEALERWLDDYGAEGAAQRGIHRRARRSTSASPGQLSLFEEYIPL